MKKIQKREKNNFYTEQSIIKSTFWGKTVLLCVQFNCIEEAHFASFGSNHSAAVKNKALRKHKL